MKARFDFRMGHATFPSHRAFSFLVAAMFIAAGCETAHKLNPNPPRYRPTNIFYKSKALDPTIKRVAVLPIATALPSQSLQSGIDMLQPLLYAELDKTKRFDLMIVSPQQMRDLTGRASWKSDDQLPADFFEKLREATDCDALFFTELTRCQAYPPLAVGWKLALVQAKPRDILWAADEVFDAGNEEVANAARQYSGQQIHVEPPLSDPDSILGSPSRFGQYSLHALLTLLPLR